MTEQLSQYEDLKWVHLKIWLAAQINEGDRFINNPVSKEEMETQKFIQNAYKHVLRRMRQMEEVY